MFRRRAWGGGGHLPVGGRSVLVGTGPAVGDFPLSSHPGGSGRTLRDSRVVKFPKYSFCQQLTIFANICHFFPCTCQDLAENF